MSLDTRRLRRFLCAGLGLAVAVACVDEYTFVKDPKTEHCANDAFDADSGETDRDCGGEDCKACELGQGCKLQRDCVAGGQCIDGFCQAPGCDNGALDEGETGVDCGGTCKPCEPGEPCGVPGDCLSKVCTDGLCVAPTCDDGVINGTETGRDCGGGLCDGCGTGSPCSEATDCRSGVCAGEEGARRCEVSCIEGTGECDGDTDVECETNLLTDPLHCGDCMTVCELAHADQACVSGRCMIASCNEPYDDCNNDVEDGCETDLESEPLHCGACGAECSDQNGTPLCEDSECQIECDDGFFDCNVSTKDGCEQNIGTDVLNCGECGEECPYDDEETPFCVGGVCGATICPDGFGNCDGMGDSCEKDLTDDVMHCGRCGGECTVFRGTPRCDENGCGVRGCETGWANCNTSDPDGGYMNGCETNTDVDPMNCGMCGRSCTVSHGTGVCIAGECRVMGCEGGWSNCDDSASDGGYATGCETNSATDDANCGTCGRNCDTLFASANATGTCSAGNCELDDCLPNFGDCDTNPNNCESDFRTDEGDCGNCDTSCSPTGTTSAGNQCVSGTCTPACDSTHANCDTQGPNGCEINTNTNATHCGGCNMACTGGRPCISGMCGCSGGLTLCDDECVNTATDSSNCGMCGTVCTGGRVCSGSVCQCPSGQTFCGGVCVDTQTDEANCGVCGRMCDTPAGTLTNTCTNGACVPGCDTLRASCDMEPWDGCEVNFASNNSHCGACNRACQFGTAAHVNPATQAGNQCSTGGACQPICAAGWENCDNEAWDGCEESITSVTRCGNCTRDCAGSACGSAGDTSCCVGSGSTYNCQSQITLSNHSTDASMTGSGTVTLNLSHTPQAGSNRLVLVVVAAEAEGQGPTGSRPTMVSYGGTTMSLGPEFTAGSAHWGADLYTYYLLESVVATKSGAQTVAVTFGGSTGSKMVAGDVIQFNGVRQSGNPLTFATPGTDLEVQATPEADPTTLTATVTVPAGGRIYALTGGLFVDGTNPATPAISPMTDTSPPQTTLASAVAGNLRAFGAYFSGTLGASSLAAGSYTVSWTWPYSGGSTLLAVVIPPAIQ